MHISILLTLPVMGLTTVIATAAGNVKFCEVGSSSVCFLAPNDVANQLVGNYKFKDLKLKREDDKTVTVTTTPAYCMSMMAGGGYSPLATLAPYAPSPASYGQGAGQTTPGSPAVGTSGPSAPAYTTNAAETTVFPESTGGAKSTIAPQSTAEGESTGVVPGYGGSSTPAAGPSASNGAGATSAMATASPTASTYTTAFGTPSGSSTAAGSETQTGSGQSPSHTIVPHNGAYSTSPDVAMSFLGALAVLALMA